MGFYRKTGASGAGAWVRIGDLPYSFIVANDSGSGSANAIKADSAIPVSDSALVVLPISATNTASPASVAFNGGAALTIKTVAGSDVAAGGLVAGMRLIEVVSGGTFRLVSDQVSSAVLAAAEEAASAANSSKGAAQASASNAANSASAAQKWASEAENVEVLPGLFSAFHWAKKAASVVTGGIADALKSAPVKASPVSADKIALLDDDGLKTASLASLQKLFGLPIGTTIMMQGNGNSPPPGYLLHNGAAVTSAYPDLRAWLLNNGATVNGNGDPIIEDMGGYFPRGWRSGQVVDSGRVFGSAQQDAMQGHKHRTPGAVANRGDAWAAVDGTESVSTADSVYYPGTTSAFRTLTGSPVFPDGVNGTPRIAAETRPVNKTFTYWIKAYAADQVPGSADFAALANNVQTLSANVQALQGRTTTLESYGKVLAWVNFNGTGTVAIRASKNVSSVADNGTGDYTVNFITAMPDANFIMVGTGSGEQEGTGGGVARQGPAFSTSSNTTTSCRVRTGYDNGALYDWPTVGVAFLR